MSDPDRLWIMVDVETSGPIYGRHSLVELGAAVGSRTRGIVDGFEVAIAPLATGEPARTSRHKVERAQRIGVAPADAIGRFEAWCRPFLDGKATFVARPAAFDWPWIVWYAWTYLGKNPFGFKAVCASSWLEAHGRKFDVTLPHDAGADARVQLEYFLPFT